MLDIYLSTVSNRMNDIMRVLTVIATIFIPLTFIVGVYGMNFDRAAGPWSMPELEWPYGYLLVWAIMIGIALAMLAFFDAVAGYDTGLRVKPYCPRRVGRKTESEERGEHRCACCRIRMMPVSHHKGYG
jgi:hypothetical protein